MAEDDTNFEDRPPAELAPTEPPPGPTDQGTCGFCGIGDGHLLDQGMERSQVLTAAVRVGEAPNWTFEQHPHPWSTDSQYVTWCGGCLRGLAHKYQRLDDLNLGAQLHVYSLWQELDGIRWHAGWESEADALDVGRPDGEQFDPDRDPEAGRLASRRFKDDLSVHLDKLNRERDVRHMATEQRRRWGLTVWTARFREEGWRP